MSVRLTTIEDHDQLVGLISDFRVTISQFRSRPEPADLAGAEEELAGYQDPKYRVFVAEESDDELAGFLVCRVEDSVVWAEVLFVSPMQRRQGVASELYDEAEKLVKQVGGDTVHNWVDPNNDRIISFLRNRNYTVLNLIELRRIRPGERPFRRIKVGQNSFDY